MWIRWQYTYGALCQFHGAEAQEGNGVQADIKAVGVVGEGNEAIYAVCERGDLQGNTCDSLTVFEQCLLSFILKTRSLHTEQSEEILLCNVQERIPLFL